MNPASTRSDTAPVLPDADALLVALVLAPGTYSRNKYFSLFQNEITHRVRRRAQMVRSVLKELTEPWPELRSTDSAARVAPEATMIDEYETPDGVQLIYRVDEFDYTRSVMLTPLEAAALRYALARAGRGEVRARDRRLVESALAGLDPTGV